MPACAGTVGFNTPLASCCVYHVPYSVECCEEVKDKLDTTAEHNTLGLREQLGKIQSFSN